MLLSRSASLPALFLVLDIVYMHLYDQEGVGEAFSEVALISLAPSSLHDFSYRFSSPILQIPTIRPCYHDIDLDET